MPSKGKVRGKQEDIYDRVAPMLEELSRQIHSDDPDVRERAIQVRLQLLEDYNKKEAETNAVCEQFIQERTKSIQNVFAQLPANVRAMTVGQIRSAGGHFQVDKDGLVQIMVPKKLRDSDGQGNSQPSEPLASSRKLNSKLDSLLSQKTSKRSRVPVTATPSEVSTRKKTARIQPSPGLNGTTRMVTRNTARKAALTLVRMAPPAPSSATVVKSLRDSSATGVKCRRNGSTIRDGSTIFHSTMLEPGMSTACSKSVSTSKEEDACLSEGMNNLSLVNPKTPGGRHRLFKKPPRKMEPHEEVIFCSKNGTPLLVEKKKPTAVTGDALSDV